MFKSSNVDEKKINKAMNMIETEIAKGLKMIPSVEEIDKFIKENGIDKTVEVLYLGIRKGLDKYIEMYKKQPELIKSIATKIINNWLQVHVIAFKIYTYRPDLINYSYDNPEFWYIVGEIVRRIRKDVGLGKLVVSR